ncbi:MAG: hypothetical protein K0U62_03700 [Actinomycetia bacterium]|nr:hypothetical protein [Actinomycetes bacterium]
MSEPQPDLVFPFEVEDRFRPLLVGLGVTRHTAWARISDSELTVKFGFLGFRAPLSNIKCTEISGPYKAYRAIGARGSFSDRGATYGSTTAGGVCVEFREPLAALDPTGHVKNDAVTITVADRPGFEAALRRAANLD